MAAPPEGEVSIDAGGGAVELRLLSWMERTMRKMQAADAQGDPGGAARAAGAAAAGSGSSAGGAGGRRAGNANSSDAGGCRMHGGDAG